MKEQHSFLIAILLLVKLGVAIAFLTPPDSTRSRQLQHTLSFPSIQQVQPHAASSIQRKSRQHELSSLQMIKNPVLPVAISAFAGAVSGGLFAGGLHAVAGPDHLASLLPRCVGQRWYSAGRVGALWGMGHGVSATMLGVVAFALKSTINSRARGPEIRKLIDGASHVTDVAVGLSLVVIGIMGFREAQQWKKDIDGIQPQSLSAAAVDPGIKTAQSRAVVLNGLLHGFSLDGAPSLAPAIAVSTWSGNLAFLAAYSIGTASAMAVTTTLIGEGTRRAGQLFHRPDIPQKLSYISSILAIGMGLFWCWLAVS